MEGQIPESGDKHSICSISSDGKTVVIGSPFYGGSSGRVQVLSYVGTQWILLGEDILGKRGDKFGRSVSVSSDGKIIAIGAIGNDKGHAQVLSYDGNQNQWNQVGIIL